MKITIEGPLLRFQDGAKDIYLSKEDLESGLKALNDARTLTWVSNNKFGRIWYLQDKDGKSIYTIKAGAQGWKASSDSWGIYCGFYEKNLSDLMDNITKHVSLKYDVTPAVLYSERWSFGKIASHWKLLIGNTTINLISGRCKVSSHNLLPSELLEIKDMMDQIGYTGLDEHGERL